MRKTTMRWLAVALALACALPCRADDTTAAAAASTPDGVSVPVWRKGTLQKPSSRNAATSANQIKVTGSETKRTGSEFKRTGSDTKRTGSDAQTTASEKFAANNSKQVPVKIVQFASSASDEQTPPPAPQPPAATDAPALVPTDAPADGGMLGSDPMSSGGSCLSCTPGCGQCSAGCGGCTGGCGGGCGSQGCQMPCGDGCSGGLWQHRSGLFGEYLYLRPTGVDMAYGFQQNGIGGAGTVPNGSVGVLHPDYSSGFRVGGSAALDCYSSFVATFTTFDSPSASSLTAPAGVGGTVESLVLHPGSVNAGSTATSIAATYGINFKMATFDYRHLLIGSQCYAVNYSVGLAYGHLGQNFQSTGSFAPPIGVIQNTTAIHYDGGGLRYGLDFQRQLGRGGFSIYGKTFVDILFGEFDATYSQVNTTTTAVQALSSWRNDRVLPILETELGLAWTGRSQHVRISAGYYNAFWFNAVTTPQYVQAVQTANYTNLGQTIAFDGLVARLDVRF